MRGTWRSVYLRFGDYGNNWMCDCLSFERHVYWVQLSFGTIVGRPHLWVLLAEKRRSGAVYWRRFFYFQPMQVSLYELCELFAVGLWRAEWFPAGNENTNWLNLIIFLLFTCRNGPGFCPQRCLLMRVFAERGHFHTILQDMWSSETANELQSTARFVMQKDVANQEAGSQIIVFQINSFDWIFNVLTG